MRIEEGVLSAFTFARPSRFFGKNWPLVEEVDQFVGQWIVEAFRHLELAGQDSEYPRFHRCRCQRHQAANRLASFGNDDFLAGGSLLVIADTLARTVIAPQQLPVGVLTALIGVPVFLFLLARDAKARA